MLRRFFLGAALLAGATAWVELEACSLGTSGLGHAGSPDSSIDAAVADVVVDVPADVSEAVPEAGCPGLTCNDECISNRDCRLCPGAPLLCSSKRQCAAACDECIDSRGAPMPVECFACDSTHANAIGTCQYDDAGSFCLSGDYLGQYPGGNGYRCGCGDVTGCPGATQVCVPLGQYDAGFCLTCGEATIGPMQGEPCKDGGVCQASAAVCQ